VTNRLLFSLTLSLCGLLAWRQPGYSQSVVPAADGTDTRVTPNGDRYDIDGGSRSSDGQNLFHSFDRLDLETGETANFLTSPDIQNVLGRIVGGDPSQINGILQLSGSNANLFLLNPAGILFGSDAQLNLPASFFATTASGIGFDGGWFDSTGTPDYAALVGTPNAFRFQGSGEIVSFADLAVSPGETLGLLGETVTATNGLSGGQILVTAVSGGNWVRLTQPGFLLSLEVPASASSVTPLMLPALLTGGGEVTLRDARVAAETAQIAGGTATIEASTVRVLGDLTVAGETVRLRDRTDAPLQLQTGGTLQIWGDRTVDILALNTLDPIPFVSGGDLRLLSNGLVSADSHFLSGGDFQVVGTLQSLFDPIILAVGDVSFDDYTGAALKIEAGGSISGGNITITEPDTTLSSSFPNDPDLDLLTTRPSLILRAGVAVSSPTGATPEFTLSDSPTTPGSIAVGDVDAGTSQVEGGVAILEAVGSIEVGNVNTAGLDVGGEISIAADGDVTAGTLFSGGAPISVSSDGSLVADNVVATGIDGGSIDIFSGDRLSLGDVDAEGLGGVGGEIQVESQGDAEIESIDARGVSDGGSIDLLHRQLRVTDFVASGLVGSTTSSIATSSGGSIRVELTDDTASFVVGDATTNGTIGNLTTETDSIDPTFTAPSGTFVRGNISIITPQAQSGQSSTSIDTTTAEADISRMQSIPLDPPSLIPVEVEVAASETRYTANYTEYFGLEPVPAVSLEKTQQVLSQIERLTGITPALIYVQFVSSVWEPKHLKDRIIRLETDPNDDVIEVVLVMVDGKPFRVPIPKVTRGEIVDVARNFRADLTNPRLRRSNRYLVEAQQLYEWLIRPLEGMLRDRGIENLSFIMDEGLRTLPIAALHDGEGFLIESYSVGLMPSLSLTSTEHVNLRNLQVLAMGSSEFAPETQLSPLPAVPTEITTIVDRLWSGEGFLNEAFTLDNLRSRRDATPYGIVHLATHGEFLEGQAGNSYIQLWDTRLHLDQIRTLNWSQPPVELLVLSACRTAVGSAEAELGFAGLAVAAGVKTALGSFWYVSDDGTLGLMTEFYSQLQTAPIKAEALRQTQLGLLEERVRIENSQLFVSSGTVPLPPELAQKISDKTFDHPYYWSAFTLIGNPW